MCLRHPPPWEISTYATDRLQSLLPINIEPKALMNSMVSKGAKQY